MLEKNKKTDIPEFLLSVLLSLQNSYLSMHFIQEWDKTKKKKNLIQKKEFYLDTRKTRQKQEVYMSAVVVHKKYRRQPKVGCHPPDVSCTL